MPSAVFLDGTATPPILGGEYALPKLSNPLEIHTSADHDLPVPGCRLDTAEIDVVNVQRNGIIEVGMVQCINNIHPELEVFVFGDADSLIQVQVKANESGTLDPGITKSAQLSRSGIHKHKAAGRVCNGQIAVIARQRRGAVASRCRVGAYRRQPTIILNLLEAREVIGALRIKGHLSAALREIPDDDRTFIGKLRDRR